MTVRVIPGLIQDTQREFPYTNVGIRDAMYCRQSEFPLLARCLENPIVPMRNLKLHLSVGGKYEENWTQICRVPYDYREGKWEEEFLAALTRMLSAIERVIQYGVPSPPPLHGVPITMAGGALYYLQREIEPDDKLWLHVLRDLSHRHYSAGPPGDDPDGEPLREMNEWLIEFSLEVIPGATPIGAKKVKLPRDMPPLNAWAQGACLDRDKVVPTL